MRISERPDVDPSLSQSRPPRWLTELIIILVVVASGFAPVPGGPEFVSRPLSIAVLMASAIVLLLRHRWPISVLAASVVFFGAAAMTGTLSPSAVLATSVAAFAVSDRLPRLTALVAGGVAVMIVGIVSVLTAIQGEFDARVFVFALAVAFGSAAGDGTRSRREYVRAITERAERAEQGRESEIRRQIAEERLRIARDLHDVVAHQISVISLNAGVASSALDRQPDKAKQSLVAIRTASRSALGEIGDLLRFLRADEGETGSPTSPPQPGLDQLDALTTRFRESGLRVTVHTDGDLARLTGVTEVVAYRAVQEGLTNAHKHGSEQRAHVLIDVTRDRAQILVTNPTDPAGSASLITGGHGLLGLRERVASVGGDLEAGPSNGGYRLAVTLPITNKEDHS